MALPLLVSACAGTVEPDVQPIDKTAFLVFNEGYDRIYDRYIEPVDMAAITVAGLSGLGKIDPLVLVTWTGTSVRLVYDDAELAEFPFPAPDDTQGWASLTVAVIQAASKVSDAIRATSHERLYEVVFDAAVSQLDRFSRYSTAEEAGDNRARREGFGGIGVRIRVEDGITRVVSVMPDTPAEQAGMRIHDAITRVDGDPIVDLTAKEVVHKLRGRRGSLVRLTVARDDRVQPVDMVMTRRHIVPETVYPRLEDGILYVRVTGFNQRTAASLSEAVDDALEKSRRGLRGLILDLRGNPGGLLDQAVAVSDLFVNRGRIVSTEGRHPGSFQRYDARYGDILMGRPLVVLVNGRSASSSEIVAAALQDLGRAVVVGTNSFGKGTVQSVYHLPNDGELILTWSRFHAPSGYVLHHLGVMPNICVAGKAGDAKALLTKLRQGHAASLPVLRAWRAHMNANVDGVAELRSACPSPADPTGEAEDLEVARRLIGDPDLYGRALALVVDANTAQKAWATTGVMREP